MYVWPFYTIMHERVKRMVETCTFTSFILILKKVYPTSYFVIEIQKHGMDFFIDFHYYCLLLLILLSQNLLRYRKSRYISPCDNTIFLRRSGIFLLYNCKIGNMETVAET